MRRWEQVLAGLSTGSIAVGSRTPLSGVPAWVTLEVVTGGFATGELRAGGELQPHEHALLARLGGPGALSPRAALNVYFLGAEGRAELAARLADGRYSVQVPEEGALLVVQWLLERNELERAQQVLDEIAPWLDRLRFYPVLDDRPLLDSAVVCLRPLRETVEQLEALRVPIEVARMNESLTVWSPLLDRMLVLFAATVVGSSRRAGSMRWASRRATRRVRSSSTAASRARFSRRAGTSRRAPFMPRSSWRACVTGSASARIGRARTSIGCGAGWPSRRRTRHGSERARQG